MKRAKALTSLRSSEGLVAGKRLLVVDDEESIRRLFVDYFTTFGYQVVTAGSGREALEGFFPGKFDCVLCDLMMPEMNGMDVLHELRVQDAKVPFFMITGYPSMETAIEAIKHGAYDYIIKPLNLEDVRIKIERAMYATSVEKSLKKANGLLWALLISVPFWLALGIIFGIVWKIV
jgi:DNA-binding NtrC family response regulator